MSEKTERIKTKRKEKIAELKDKSKKRATAVKNKLKAVLPKKIAAPNTVTQNRLELMVTIVERNKAEFYCDLLQSFQVNLQFVALGHGTADAKMLGYLGLSESEKAVIFSVIQENKIPDAFRALDEKFKSIKNGKGIAYTLPFTSVIGTLIYGFLSNNRMAVKEKQT